MNPPEFSRPIDRRQLKAKPVAIEANEAERSALAARFGLVAIGRLAAEIALAADADAIDAHGTFEADVVQSCAVSGDDLQVAIRGPFAVRFVPENGTDAEEIELQEDELDEIPFNGHFFDLGEAVAQSLALAIDPYATGPNADQVRKEQDLSDDAISGPFAALAALKKD